MQGWTLSVEFFFYLTFPLLLASLSTRTDTTVVGLAVAVAAVMIFFRLPSTLDGPSLAYEFLGYVPLPVLRWPEFVFGVCLGVLCRRGLIPTSRPGFYGFALTSVAVMASSQSHWVGPFAALCFGGVIALTVTSLDEGPVLRLLASPVLVLLGGASYGIYILQLPVHKMLEALLGHLGTIIYIPVLIGLSVLVFRFYEESIRRQLRGGRDRRR